MSIAILDNGGRKGSSSGYVHGMSCVSILNVESPEIFAGDPRFLAGEEREGEKGEEADVGLPSSSSSSIGKNSDLSGRSSSQNEADSGVAEEVQSSYKGPLHAIGALEEVLPIRRGISRFYNGKSMSFTSLADASSYSSVKDIAKPENAYTRRRRNLLASSLFFHKNRTSQLKSSGGGISKRLSNSSQSTLALAVAMTRCETNNRSEDSIPKSPSSHLHLQCRRRQSHCNELSSSSPRNKFSGWRSFSLADLRQCASPRATCSTSGSSIVGEAPLKI